MEYNCHPYYFSSVLKKITLFYLKHLFLLNFIVKYVATIFQLLSLPYVVITNVFQSPLSSPVLLTAFPQHICGCFSEMSYANIQSISTFIFPMHRRFSSVKSFIFNLNEAFIESVFRRSNVRA